MGQILNLEIKYDGDVIANAYYHWSAYTSCAAELLEIVLDKYEKEKASLDAIFSSMTPATKQAAAVLLLTATGAGLSTAEIELIEKDMEAGKMTIRDVLPSSQIVVAKDRNAGLISIHKDEIETTEYWGDHLVSIDFKTNEVDFQDVYALDPEESRELVQGIGDYVDYQRVVLPFDIFEMTLEEAKSFCRIINSMYNKCNTCEYILIDAKQEFYMPIE